VAEEFESGTQGLFRPLVAQTTYSSWLIIELTDSTSELQKTCGVNNFPNPRTPDA
jgi:hypothetical protein